MENNEKKVFGRSKIVLLLLVVAVLAVGGTVFANTFLKKDPFTRLMMGYMNLYTQRTQRYEADMSFSVDKENPKVKEAFNKIPMGKLNSSSEQFLDFVSKVLPKAGIKYSAIVNTKDDPLCAGAKFEVMYDNKALFDAGGTIRPWDVTVYSNSLLSKPLYMDLGGKIRESSGIDLSAIKIKDYIDVLYEKDDFTKNLYKSKYVDILKEKLKDNLKAEGSNKIVLNLKYSDTLKLYHDILAEAAKDTALRDFVVRKFEKIAEVAIKNGDYKLAGVSEEEFKNQVESAKKQFADNWENMITEINENYGMEKYDKVPENVANMPVKYVFSFNGDTIDRVKGEISVDGITANFDINMQKYSTDGFIFGNAAESDSLESAMSNNGMSLLPNIAENAGKILKSDAYEIMKKGIIDAAKESLSKEDAARIEDNFNQLLALSGMMGN